MLISLITGWVIRSSSSDYETNQMNKQKSNGPTDMPGTSSDDFGVAGDAASANSDLDFDV